MSQQHETRIDNDHYLYLNYGRYSIIDNTKFGISQRFKTKQEALTAFENNQLEMFYLFDN